MIKRYTSSLSKILSIILMITPFIWIYRKTDAAKLLEVLKSVPTSVVLVTTSIGILTILLQGLRWWILIRRFSPGINLFTILRIQLISSFYSIALPTSAAQDVVRAAILSRSDSNSRSWATTWLTRLLGLFVLLLFSAWGLLMLDNIQLISQLRSTMLVVCASLFVFGAFSFSKRITRPIRIILSRYRDNRVFQFLENLRQGVYEYKNCQGTLLVSLLLTVFVQLIVIFNASLVLFAVTGKFYLYECLAFIPLIEIISMSISITPGGIGFREVFLALMFNQLGLSTEQLGSYVILSYVVMMSRLVGALPLLYSTIFQHKQFKTNS